MTDTIMQLQELGLTIYVTCKGYDASMDAPYIYGTKLPADYDGDTHAHLLTSSCKPTKITRVYLDIEQVK
jgi:hypothetical protein|tara:strand:- start:470 stop:679 length:210 start_codon:yes stop_codon:yes gene_type:complete